MKQFAVLGYPINHSLSPLIFKYLFNEHNIDGDYTIIEIEPNEFAKSCRQQLSGFSGINVTAPYKEKITAYIDEVDKDARIVGAVNCLSIESGKIKGYNTDVFGFTENLLINIKPEAIANSEVLVLGAGGAAKAVLLGLRQLGAQKVSILNRNCERAQNIAELFGYNSGDLSLINDKISRSDLVVNCTTCGMNNLEILPIEEDAINNNTLFYDLVYNPLETEFLKKCRAKDCKIIDGLGMLIFQAFKSFEIWFGYYPNDSYDKVRKLLEDKLR